MYINQLNKEMLSGCLEEGQFKEILLCIKMSDVSFSFPSCSHKPTAVVCALARDSVVQKKTCCTSIKKWEGRTSNTP